jgi:hypothetical protein
MQSVRDAMQSRCEVIGATSGPASVVMSRAGARRSSEEGCSSDEKRSRDSESVCQDVICKIEAEAEFGCGARRQR